MNDSKAVQTIQKGATDLRTMLKQDNITARFKEILKDRAPAFITSIINVSDSSKELSDISRNNPVSIIRCAAVAAALNLPIEKSLGYAWIVPYKEKGQGVAQFQIGYKGFIQLALRTGQYLRLNAVHVYGNQFKAYNTLTEELNADLGVDPVGEIVGYAVYFKLINGFEKTVYKAKKELLSHGKRYSKGFTSDYSTWKTHQDEMCLKTLIKQVLTKWGIMSTDIQKAAVADQAVVVNDDLDSSGAFEYPDNPSNDITAETRVTEAPKGVTDLLTSRQKFEAAKAGLFQKKGKKATDELLSTLLTKELADHNDIELDEITAKIIKANEDAKT